MNDIKLSYRRITFRFREENKWKISNEIKICFMTSIKKIVNPDTQLELNNMFLFHVKKKKIDRRNYKRLQRFTFHLYTSAF